MSKPNVVVSTVVGLDPPLEGLQTELSRAGGGISVRLEGGRRVRLDPDDQRSAGLARVLDGLSKRRLPVYLEVDPATEVVTRLLVPHVTRVADIRRLDQDVLGIELERSHARHVLRRGTPGFEALEREVREALRTGAPIVLTEDGARGIIDVRGYTPDPEGPLPPSPRPPLPPRADLPWRWFRELLDRLWNRIWWPWRWFGCISPAYAQQVFDAMNTTTCDPLTVPAPCIPFRYPDDGCWARAHEMCRLMIAMGLSPKKVWIRGTLNVSTRNNPDCEVWWTWHVAPTLCVRGRFPLRWNMVIDPSLFTTPVTQDDWKDIQGDPNATLTSTTASIYFLSGVTDPTYSQTNQHLDFYRLQLQARSVQQGPPPYSHCS